MKTPFSLAPLDVLDDVELGHISEYRRFMQKGPNGQVLSPDVPVDEEIEALDRALTDVETEIMRRGRLLLFVDADIEAAALEHPLVAEWMRRGWKVHAMGPYGNRRHRQVLVRLIAPDVQAGVPRTSLVKHHRGQDGAFRRPRRPVGP